MRSLAKFLSAVSIACLPWTAIAADTAASLCVPGDMGKRSSMLYVLSSIGFNNEFGRLCKIREQAIQQISGPALAAFKDCLRERNISEAAANAAIRAGEIDAQQVYELSTLKESVCTSVHKQFEE